MTIQAYARSLAARLFRRSRVDDEMDEELRSHIEHRADDLERSGLKRAEALRRARIEFGGHQRFREECYEAIAGNHLETLAADLRISIRILRKSPGFTAVAIVTLALAIGANAAVFGVLNGLILRPLKVPQAESLYGSEYGDGAGWQSYPNYLDLRDRNRSFDGLAAFNFAFVGMDAGEGDPMRATGFAVTGNYFDVLKLQPHVGRFFRSEDERGAGSAPYIVLGYDCWQSRFQGDRGVVGRVVRLNKHPFTIIGVAPPGFYGTLLFVHADMFVPIVNQEQLGAGSLNARGEKSAIFEVFGHLRPGVTPAQAVADMNSVASYLAKTYPNECVYRNSTLSRTGLTSFGRPALGFLAGLMLLAGLILMAACANLGSLFAAHTSDRSREVAMRLALGSGRGRILRQFLTQAAVISLAGGAVGLLGCVVLLRWLSAWNPFPGTPIHLPVTPDATVYLVALSLALLSGLLFGIVPVRQVFGTDPYGVIKAGPSGRFGRRLTVRDALIAVQIAICAVLVTSSMVAVRGLLRSLYGNFGFDRNTMLVAIDLGMAGYTVGQAPETQKRILRAMETIPGVQRSGLVTYYPPLAYGAGMRANIFKEETRDLRLSNVAARPFKYDVSPGYFESAGTTLLAGRDFDWHDDAQAPAVAVVNRTLAGRLFGTASGAVGKCFRLQDGTRVQVVGVVEDGKYLSVTEDPQPAVFLPFLRSPSNHTWVLVRSRRAPQETASAMRRKLRQLDAALPLDVKTWDSLLDVALFPSRVATVSLGALGLMGAMLSITGIFGMAAYSVSRRLKELGIRLALGAQRREILQAALGRALKLLAVGSAAGLCLGVLAGRVLASIVYQASPRDPVVLAAALAAMSAVGLLATFIPAQRALSLDPVTLLREE